MVRRKRKKARDFGDNPKIRGGLDKKSFHKKEPWERHYRGVKKKSARVGSYTRKVKGKRIRVKGHIRKLV